MNNTILIVDDNPFDHELIEDILSQTLSDLRILTAQNGDEALQVLEHSYLNGIIPKLIISDINMPKLDGLELYNSLKLDVRFRKIKFVLFTTSSLSQKLFSEQGITVYKKHFNMIEYERTVLEIIINAGFKKHKKIM